MSPSGTLTTLYNFDGPHGASPAVGLVQASDGNFYGTTAGGGFPNSHCSFAASCGTVFRVTPAGVLNVIHRFQESDGANPEASLIEGTDGNLYGTTAQGGTYHDGTIFKIARDGTLTTLHSFS